MRAVRVAKGIMQAPVAIEPRAGAEPGLPAPRRALLRWIFDSSECLAVERRLLCRWYLRGQQSQHVCSPVRSRNRGALRWQHGQQLPASPLEPGGYRLPGEWQLWKQHMIAPDAGSASLCATAVTRAYARSDRRVAGAAAASRRLAVTASRETSCIGPSLVSCVALRSWSSLPGQPGQHSACGWSLSRSPAHARTSPAPVVA